MLELHASVLALMSASATLLAQEPKPFPPREPATTPARVEIREPQLIPSQKVWAPQGKCKKRRDESARLSLEIAQDGTPQKIYPLTSSDDNAKELATQVVLADRFVPAVQNGTPFTAQRSILVEMKACVDTGRRPSSFGLNRSLSRR